MRPASQEDPPTVLDTATLPVEALADLGRREGWRPRPVYQAHRWFARRFSSAFRALLVAARLPVGGDFWDAYTRGVDYAGRCVLDPFVGGGTTVVEASRLGASVVGVDIDPVACAVTRFELGAAAVPDLTEPLDRLRQRVGRRLERYYHSTTPEGDPCQVLHFFWVQLADCLKCGATVEAHPHYQLAHEADGDRQWAFCHHCHAVAHLDRAAERFRCRECRRTTVVGAGPVDQGRLHCPACGHRAPLIRQPGPPRWRLFALETLPTAGPKRRPLAQRRFQPARDHDRARLRAARRALGRRQLEGGGWRGVPVRAIPCQGRADDRLIAYGYRFYHELFNPRQLLHLATTAEAIGREPDAAARAALAVAFSDHLTTNCMLTHYAFGWRRLAPLFSVRAFRHVPRPVELNPWLDGTGRGTYPHAVHAVRRAVADARQPQLALPDDRLLRQPAVPSGPWSVWRRDSRDLEPLGDASVDLVLTDPPYFDNIAYAELADFYRPWLQQLGLADGVTGWRGNLAAHGRDGAAAARFAAGLRRCLAEVARVLKPDGRLVFTFQHRAAGAWLALTAALAAAGLRPVRTFPLLGNSPAGLHRHAGTISWDAVLVFRTGGPRRDDDLPLSPHQAAAARRHADAWAARLGRAGALGFEAADRANFLRACLVFGALGWFGPGAGAGRPLGQWLAEEAT